MVCDKDCFNCKHPDCVWTPPPVDEKAEERKARVKVYNHRYKAKKYAKAKADGICVNCFKKPATHGVLCYECWIRGKRRTLERYHKNKQLAGREEWKEKGLCYLCGAPVMPGKKQCEKHYKLSVESLKKAREKQRTNEKV